MNAPNDVQYQLCEPNHYKAIADIYNEYVQLGDSTMEETLQTVKDINAWVSKFNDREKLYVILKNEAVIGWGIIKRYSDRNGYRFACETSIYITSSELRKGYGTTMKKKLLVECKALGYHHLVAKIFASNKASIDYNLKLGYTIVGQQKEIGFRDGQWLDVMIMQYIF